MPCRRVLDINRLFRGQALSEHIFSLLERYNPHDFIFNSCYVDIPVKAGAKERIRICPV